MFIGDRPNERENKKSHQFVLYKKRSNDDDVARSRSLYIFEKGNKSRDRAESIRPEDGE